MTRTARPPLAHDRLEVWPDGRLAPFLPHAPEGRYYLYCVAHESPYTVRKLSAKDNAR